MLSAAYRHARAHAPSAASTIPSKGPALGERQLRVAVFAAARNDGRTWTDLLEEWNASVDIPEAWEYGNYRNFARDARDTYERVMGTPLKWVGRKGRKATHDTEGESEDRERENDGGA